MIEDLLFISHDDSFEEKCMGAWDEDDFMILVYTSNVTHRRKKMRDFFKRNRPSDSFIQKMILEKQYTAVEILASFYEFSEELQRNVLNKDERMRRAYHKHHQFRRDLEQKFVRRGEKSEVQAYYSRYARTMDRAALDDCRNIKKLNMGCQSLTLSAYESARLEKKKKKEQESIY